MKYPKLPIALVLLSATLGGCANLSSPSADHLAAMPVATYPEAPPQGEYVYKLPAGQPIDLRILVDGDALASGVNQTVGASLKRDLYLYKDWASEDGQHWQHADKLIAIHLGIKLPSYASPVQGEIHMTVDRPDQ